MPAGAGVLEMKNQRCKSWAEKDFAVLCTTEIAASGEC